MGGKECELVISKVMNGVILKWSDEKTPAGSLFPKHIWCVQGASFKNCASRLYALATSLAKENEKENSGWELP